MLDELTAMKPLDCEQRRAARASKDRDTSGRGLTWDDLEPRPDPIDGEQLIATIADTILTYIVMEREAALAVALWIIHTHLLDHVQVTPAWRSRRPKSGAERQPCCRWCLIKPRLDR